MQGPVRHFRLAAPFAFLAFFIQYAQAEGTDELVVLGHDPGARPAAPLIGEFLGRLSEPEDETVPPPGEAEDNLAAGGGLPRTSSLVPSAGSASVVYLDVPLTSPLCVIGPDPVSQRWLVRNRDRLVRMGAFCVLVKTTGHSQVEKLRKLARPVPVYPLPFDRLAAIHKIRTVPVLLAGKGARVQ